MFCYFGESMGFPKCCAADSPRLLGERRVWMGGSYSQDLCDSVIKVLKREGLICRSVVHWFGLSHRSAIKLRQSYHMTGQRTPFKRMATSPMTKQLCLYNLVLNHAAEEWKQPPPIQRTASIFVALSRKTTPIAYPSIPAKKSHNQDLGSDTGFFRKKSVFRLQRQ